MGELLRAASEEQGERGQYIREHWTVSEYNISLPRILLYLY